MKLMSICIPTYKRPTSLIRCIDSVASQILQYNLESKVEIYVANDASPDNTADVLEDYESEQYFRRINRAENLGMSANIKLMLEETLDSSEFQLIITDDDFLLPNTLARILDLLESELVRQNNVAVIWTPRYSYTEDGAQQGLVCHTFKRDTLITASTTNAGRYMYNGFVLSGLFWKSSNIDFTFWEKYIDNAYFPVICTGELISRLPAIYWHQSIVHHSVLNECHWERWGNSDAEITLRLFIDFVNAYVFMGNRVNSKVDRFRFYLASFPGVFQMTNSLLITSSGFYLLSDNEINTLLNNDRVAYAKLESPIKTLLYFIGVRIIVECFLIAIIFKILSIITPEKSVRERRKRSFVRIRQWLHNAAFVRRWAGL